MDPLGGTQTIVAIAQLSVACASYSTIRSHCPRSARRPKLGEQVICGPSPSTTVTSNVQYSTSPAASFPRHATLLLPSGNTVPDGRLQIRLVPSQLSVTPTSNFTSA